VDPARFDMERCAGGGIIRSSVDTRYQLGLLAQAGCETAPLSGEAPGDGTRASAVSECLQPDLGESAGTSTPRLRTQTRRFP
jgi:hypothetical protein